MGMTIDEAIKHGKEQLHIFGKCDHADFIKCSIDTMRKYQKICKILDKSDNGELCMYDTIQEIEEVRDEDN